MNSENQQPDSEIPFPPYLGIRRMEYNQREEIARVAEG